MQALEEKGVPPTARSGIELYATPQMVVASAHTTHAEALACELLLPVAEPTLEPADAVNKQLLKLTVDAVTPFSFMVNTPMPPEAVAAFLPAARELLARGASVPASFALHAAASVGAELLVAALLSLCSDRATAVNACDQQRMTPLMYAAAKAADGGPASLCFLLVAEGASTTAKDGKGRTAHAHLQLALRNSADFRRTFGLPRPAADHAALLALLGRGVPQQAFGEEEEGEDEEADFDDEDDENEDSEDEEDDD